MGKNLVGILYDGAKAIGRRALPYVLALNTAASGIYGCAGSQGGNSVRSGLIIPKDQPVEATSLDSTKVGEVYGPPSPKKSFLEGLYALPEDELLLWGAKKILLNQIERKLGISKEQADSYKTYVQGLDPSSEEGARKLNIFFRQYLQNDEWDPTTPQSEVDNELRSRINCAKEERAIHFYNVRGVNPPVGDLFDEYAIAILENGCPSSHPVIRVDENPDKLYEEKKERDATFPNGKRAWYATNNFGRFERIPSDIEQGPDKMRIKEAAKKYDGASNVGDNDVNNKSGIAEVGMFLQRAKEGREFDSGNPNSLVDTNLFNVQIVPFPDPMDSRRYNLSVNVVAKNEVFLSGDTAQIVFARYGAYGLEDTANSIVRDSIPLIASADLSKDYFVFNFSTREVFMKGRNLEDLIMSGVVLNNVKGEMANASQAFDFSKVGGNLPILWGVPIKRDREFPNFENYTPLTLDGEFNTAESGQQVSVLFPVVGASPDSLGHYRFRSRLDLVPTNSGTGNKIVEVGSIIPRDSVALALRRADSLSARPPIDIQDYLAFNSNSTQVAEFTVPSDLVGRYTGVFTIVDLSRPIINEKKVKTGDELTGWLDEVSAPRIIGYEPLEVVKFPITIE